MQINSNNQYNFGTTYEIKLNEKQKLIVEHIPSEKKDEDTEVALKKIQKEQKAKASQKSNELSEDEKQLVNELSARDSEVKAHEAAHQAAGAGLTGGASYTYQQGPDGKMYAIGGEVSITFPATSNPQEAIKNAKQIAAAAMAAGNPSPQDFAVASSARIMEMKAQQQLVKKQQDEMLGKENYSTQSISLQQNNNIPKEPFDISA